MRATTRDLEIVSTAATADALGLSPRTVRWMVAHGKLPATKIGARWYVPLHQLAELVAPSTSRTPEAPCLR